MEFLEEPIGKIWTEQDLPQDIADDSYQNLIASKAVDFLTKTPSRSVLVSGERGTGKSTIINLISKELKSKGWEILVADASDIIAGQTYIGMLEGQIKNLVYILSNEGKSLWVIPKFHELYYSGKNIQNPSGILDRVLPFIEKSNVTVLAEDNSVELEKILKFRPQIRTIMEIIRLEPLSQDGTLNLAGKWLKLSKDKEMWSNISQKDLGEAFTFSRQFLGFSKEPGNFLSFLKLTQSIVEANSSNTIKTITTDDFISSVSAISGLPLSILDDRQKLDIEDLQKRFYTRIIGQDEAVGAIIERIAMMKAGFTDSTRPLGIFLFVGPTGTGKTEIAKTLAEFLFASDDKMIRIDMSEFQTPDSLNRLIGSSEDTESVSLVDEIRKNPFSVLLLDEFEKANPNIWNLFLQLFDDARLTDLGGNTADFRHAIIIMTSNLGASIPTEPGIGFGNVKRGFDPQTITKSLYKTFKPEFINRIDRIVTFNPLSKTTMRQILKNELNKVLQRRGFRQRQWAVEWDESALEFLLEKGFSMEFGARPMKRAIEQYLLAPLAMTIVTNQFPQGDQFLFISKSDNSLKVDFIDPDAPEINWKERKKSEEAQHEKAKYLNLKKIALEPQGILAEVEILQKEFDNLREHTEEKQWRNRKENLMLQMNEQEFWSNNDRKKILSEIEYRDRFEQSLSTIASIVERLSNLRKKHSNFPLQLIKQVADRILLMQLSREAFAKDMTQDAVIKVLYEPSAKQVSNEQIDFWEKLSQMYLQWAKKRKMAYEVIAKNVFPDRCEFIMTAEGFAAYQVLEQERGIHIWEQLTNENKYERTRVRIDVRALSAEAASAKESLHDTVKMIFDSPASSLTKIVSRYRNKPSPLVRDAVAGWRSGKLDKIFSGDFDLIE